MCGLSSIIVCRGLATNRGESPCGSSIDVIVSRVCATISNKVSFTPQGMSAVECVVLLILCTDTSARLWQLSCTGFYVVRLTVALPLLGRPLAPRRGGRVLIRVAHITLERVRVVLILWWLSRSPRALSNLSLLLSIQLRCVSLSRLS